ncbi:sulfite exporter TauE/SafE family protein [Actinopolyspora mzabensis]|nr:sulfite exporter TauE/SafE family protein [Actinopolyspora mzabensis]
MDRTETDNSHVRPDGRVFRVNIAIGAVVVLGWLVFGGEKALESIQNYWSISVTMIFGSLIGGGTSEGGGAVAFPMFTKVLQLPADDARLFTYAIQSVGMTAASICILYMKVPIERRVLLLGGPAGVAGVILSATLLAPSMDPRMIRIYFTVLMTGLALALLVLHVRKVNDRNRELVVFGKREIAIILFAGLFGGIISGLVGVGENTALFIMMVLLFRISEKVATPTTVIVMTIVSVAAFLTHLFVLRDFTEPVVGYWLAAVPIVVFGAPLGAVICSKMSRKSIRLLLIFLIAVEFVSTLLFIPISNTTMFIAGTLLLLLTVVFYRMTRSRRYSPENERTVAVVRGSR